MNMMNKVFPRAVKALFVLALFLPVLSGCQSLQEDKRYRTGSDNPGLLELEDLVVPLDREVTRAGLETARAKIVSLEKSGIKDSLFEGTLAAWSGRLYVIQGRTRDARAEFAKAKRLAPGITSVRVLEIRLEKDPAKRLLLCETALGETAGFEDRTGEINIELGRVRLETGNFRGAVAALDSAFPQLRPVYRSTYAETREKAWTLRNVEPGMREGTAAIVLKNEISWEDALTLSNNETELLRFLTAGQDAAELFRRLRELDIIPATQDTSLPAGGNASLPLEGNASLPPGGNASVPPAEPLRTTLLRGGAAWYLWHLLAENRGRALLVRYSSRYPDRSPIPDLERHSAFFDSVLGCVERQFMALPDGRNFQAVLPVSGSDFLAMLKKLAAAIR